MKKRIWPAAFLTAFALTVWAQHDHEGHDHPVAEHGHEDHGDPDGHEEHGSADAHDEHGHGEAEGLNVSAEMVAQMGFEIKTARGGVVSRMAVFPAEILLNRDRSSAVPARYPSVIRQVFAEVGDSVRQGDVLASLENRETLTVYTVSAPLDGVIISKNASVGESADAGGELYRVADLSSVWADISIFPQYLHWIKNEMPVEFVASDGRSAQGTVEYISPLISHETRTFTARCVLKGAGRDFAPGAFVRARMVTESKRAAVRVEREAVQLVKGQSVVFISDEHGFESRDVVPGVRDSRFVEITQGLVPGERYVAAGAFSLKAEMVTSGMDPHAGHGH